jgi:hypothetical protein
METRSQCANKLLPQYEVNIDFDEASKEWLTNKKSMGNGSYKYICGKISENTNKKCIKNPQFGHQFCSFHMKTCKNNL